MIREPRVSPANETKKFDARLSSSLTDHIEKTRQIDIAEIRIGQSTCKRRKEVRLKCFVSSSHKLSFRYRRDPTDRKSETSPECR